MWSLGAVRSWAWLGALWPRGYRGRRLASGGWYGGAARGTGALRPPRRRAALGRHLVAPPLRQAGSSGGSLLERVQFLLEREFLDAFPLSSQGEVGGLRMVALSDGGGLPIVGDRLGVLVCPWRCLRVLHSARQTAAAFLGTPALGSRAELQAGKPPSHRLLLVLRGLLALNEDLHLVGELTRNGSSAVHLLDHTSCANVLVVGTGDNDNGVADLELLLYGVGKPGERSVVAEEGHLPPS